MGLEDTLVMLRVLGRTDIRMRAVGREPRTDDASYFVGLNRFEIDLATQRYRLTPGREFCEDMDCAGIYELRTQ
jgi:hypothetical protein